MGRNLLETSTHFVWATWDRLPLITPEMERELFRYIEGVCHDLKCEVLALGGMPDHVHLLVMVSSTVAFGELMQQVKGGSSRWLSQTFCPGEWFQWQGSYGAFCVEPQNRAKVIAYIANQKRRHAEGSLWPAIEKTFDERFLLRKPTAEELREEQNE